MDASDVFTRMFATSDLVAHSFALRSTLSVGEATDLVGWLASEFMLARCAWFASAVAQVRGREHYVAFLHTDGRLAHAVAAAAPQFDPDNLRGYGCDILGRRPLSEMLLEMNSLNDHILVEVGHPAEANEFDDGELDAMIDVASQLPWCAALVGRPRPDPDGEKLLSAARRLGLKRP
ncbi:hypothetical protein HFO56_24165 [Rhizobium laguerreae]|uniref:hypothetical protein n=1 Tax=Rhizobium laguerreae TaxID=1076926 RepID=UPI001C90EBB3|nr:hypothetical protein [Rhizobium laguerreae]MBY3155425.1 hypothetical protein [Rhizobium laguerreae]